MTDHEDLSTTGADPTSELFVNFLHEAQALFLGGGVEITLRAVLDLSVATIEGCDFAGIFVLQGGRLTSPVQMGPLVTDLEASQLRAESGPCLDVIAQGVPVYAEDLALDSRWPAFGAEAAELGVRSLLALRLSTDGTIGALNLYARYPSAFGAVDRAKALVLAGLAGIALSLAKDRDEDVRQAENMRHALVTRELVGQAQGILMERERITAEQAFDILRRASQHLNVKLREVAQDLVDTGERPVTGPAKQPQEGPAPRS